MPIERIPEGFIRTPCRAYVLACGPKGCFHVGGPTRNGPPPAHGPARNGGAASSLYPPPVFIGARAWTVLAYCTNATLAVGAWEHYAPQYPQRNLIATWGGWISAREQKGRHVTSGISSPPVVQGISIARLGFPHAVYTSVWQRSNPS